MAPGSHTIAVRYGERARAYVLRVPPRMAGGAPPALVLAFHGGGGDAEQFRTSAGLDAVADREGVLVVYPFGSGPLPRRLLTWNAGECCGYAMNRNVDDVGFVAAVLDDVARRVPYDRRRVFATGHSNGAMMAYRLAAERADLVAAIIPVGGAYSLDEFAPSRPVAVLHIHSVDDPRAIYAGGIGPPFPGTETRSSHRPVMAGLERWARLSGCRGEPRVAEQRSGSDGSANASQTATLLRWDGCARTAPVAHWRLTGVGHGWPGARTPVLREDLIGPPTTLVNAAEEVWKFVAAVATTR